MVIYNFEPIMVELSDLIENPHNGTRSYKSEDLKILKSSIEKNGLITPLTAYQRKDGKYVIVSGNRRFRALKSLYDDSFQVAVNLCEMPANDEAESELMLSANITRNHKSDFENEVRIASSLWNSLSDSKRKMLSGKYRLDFIEEHKEKLSKVVDKDKFISDNFRPRYYFIRENTGLSWSNKTISNAIRNAIKGDSEVETSLKEKEELKITIHQVLHGVKTLHKKVSKYEEYSGTLPLTLCVLKDTLENVLDEMKNE